MKFEGLKPEGLNLLAENRFNDSKAFYEENKAKIKTLVTDQLRALLDELFDTMVEINPDFILNPSRCISRVRRDTRFTHDKTLYRENLWIMFRHQKNELPTPSFWFEFFPDGYTYGCGIVSASPAFMEAWRDAIKQNPEPLVAATERAMQAGMIMEDNRYKRSKAEADSITGIAADWYDQKQAFMLKHSGSIKTLANPKKLVNELIGAYTAMQPLYDYMLSVTKRYNCE